MEKNWLELVSLVGKKITLIPLQPSHKAGLITAASDGSLWELWYTSAPSAETMDMYISEALQQLEDQTSLPFVVVDNKTQKIIGCTRFMNVTAKHKRLEIGSTWYAKSAQRTGINRECKYLLLSHAFEKLGCICVQFKTDWFNQTSRNAIARLGAKQDGILRNDRLNADGTYRDTVVFSIINQEWHGVKKSLLLQMDQYGE
ncbi:GNAT family N-acetyltransferase [Echinicola strongylocentroti]|uniref:GNAT family N-acetyltransferase n=1 Tax=Echinicola strongylocentroti TaxID=1795355 RepID=A0A2Z4IJF9_9BACT|nr:GNAT family protein [Echinicola strongylocentroti]AWW30830.1 GNAT family N-acetyltransferase [Echinicola strongylocentroti]